MFISWHDIGMWAIGVLGTTCANILTFLFFTSITGTNWFKRLLTTLTDDFNNIIKLQRMKEQAKIAAENRGE